MKNLIMIVLSAITLMACNAGKNLTNSGMQKPQTNSSLTETYWKLIELNGKPITPADGNKREMHLILTKEGNKVNGNGGCNIFMGTYIEEAGVKIKFSQMAGTLMACINMENESAFMKMLQMVDNYAIQGTTLSLNKAKMAPLAKFEAVLQKQ